MASNKSSIPSANALPFDEHEWVINMRNALEEEIDEDDIRTPVSVFSVPKTLLSCKPEAYIPQLFALGPYHHWQPKLYDMERYKLAAARRTQACLQGLKLHPLVQQFTKHEYKIRCHYQRNFDLNGETLAWMMAIDASFLFEFLRNYANKDGEVQEEAPTRKSQKVYNESMKTGYNMIIRDITMLENQIPLFLLRKLSNLQCSTKELADIALSNMLVGFVKEISPFRNMENSQCADDIVHHAHLLELLYCTIVPKLKGLPTEIDEIIDQNCTTELKEIELVETSNVKKLFNRLWKFVSGLNGGPIIFVKQVIGSEPIKFLVKFPWKVITTLPVFSIIKLPVENFFSQLNADKSKNKDQTDHLNKPPLVEEITIPSVTELVRAGIKFSPARGDITTIEFDKKTKTLYLPTIILDVNTEVILRNLVAYEALVVSGPLVFTRYTELMNGIVDTEEDVKILREKGIVVNQMKSDGEAAEVWNGMSKSVKLTKVVFLDRVIGDVNKYYGSRWRVKSREFLKKYVFGSWQVLTLLAAALLLFLTCVQAFCSVYSCRSHWTQISNINNN